MLALNAHIRRDNPIRAVEQTEGVLRVRGLMPAASGKPDHERVDTGRGEWPAIGHQARRDHGGRASFVHVAGERDRQVLGQQQLRSVGKRHHDDLAHVRLGFECRSDLWRVADETSAASFGIDETK